MPICVVCESACYRNRFGDRRALLMHCSTIRKHHRGLSTFGTGRGCPGFVASSRMDNGDFTDLLTPPSRSGGTQWLTVVVVLGLGTLVAAGAVMLFRQDARADTGSEVGVPTTMAIATTSTSQAIEEPAVFPGFRSHTQLAFDPATETMVMFGGQTRGPPAAGTWLFDLRDRSWRDAPESTQIPPLRVGHATVYVDSLDGV